MARPDRGWMKKAGNLRHGFTRSDGEFILILDADFAPRPDLPLEMLPYLDAEPSLGIVQSPQYFRTRGRMSWMERGAGAVQELFYRLVQVSRDRHQGAICVGSCAIYRREALRENGGTTLIEHSEDVHTGFDLRRAGWGLRYIPVPLAAGLCPSDPDSFLVQQYRWCSGSMSLLGSRKFWTTKMAWRTRCCYLSGFCYYVHTALFTFMAPAIPLVMLIFIPDRVRLINYVFIIPSMIYNVVVFPAWHRSRFGPEAFMAKLLYGWAHLFALWDICRRKRLGWQPISALLAAARAVGSIPDLLATLGQIERLGIGSLFRLYVDTDPGNPKRYVVVFQQGVLSLPDESYYREERFAGIRGAFVAHVRRMLELAEQPEADKAAERIFALETAVAAYHWDKVASRDKEKTYNLYTWDDALVQGPDLSGWLAALDPPVGAFHGDLREGALDVAEIAGRQRDDGGGDVFFEAMQLGGAGDRRDPWLLRQ